MTALLEGKIAVVTGGTNGLGRAIAIGFAEHGAAAVIIADRSEVPRDGGDPTHELILRQTQSSALFVGCDVSVSAQVARVFEVAETAGAVDVVANIAGVAPEGGLVSNMSDEAIDHVIDVNLKGTIYGCREAARVMIPRGRGSIINMSSIVGFRSSARNVGYSASKGGVRSLTYSVAAQLGPHGIRVNVLHPGVVETQMTRDAGISAQDPSVMSRIPARRVGRPSEVAGVAVFLASELSSYVNGASLAVDGGMSTAP